MCCSHVPTVCLLRQVCPSVLSALMELFASTQGPSKWVAKTNWAAASDPCAKGKVWQGLTCSTSGGMAIVTYVGISWFGYRALAQVALPCARAGVLALPRIAVPVARCSVKGGWKGAEARQPPCVADA